VLSFPASTYAQFIEVGCLDLIRSTFPLNCRNSCLCLVSSEEVARVSRQQLRHLTVNQLEDVVEDKVVAGRVTHQLESLGVILGALLLVDQELAGNENDDAALKGGLGIEGRNLVLDLLERKRRELLDDGVDAKGGGGLKSQHGLLAVEACKSLAVRVELVVVELDELLCDLFKVASHFV